MKRLHAACAAGAAVLCALCVYADSDTAELTPIVVTATGVPTRLADVVAPVTVIEREQIARSGARPYRPALDLHHQGVVEGDVGRAVQGQVVARLLQVALGVTTLLMAVPVILGAAHQAVAMLLFTVALYLVHALRRV